MQIGASLLIFAALERLSEEPGAISPARERIWVAWLACGVVLLSGSSLLGMVWAGAALCAALVAFPRAKSARLIRSHRFLLLVSAPFLMGLATHYLWTLLSGTRPYSGASTDLRNLLFIGYELLGFSGLGPGRTDIRTGGVGVFRPYLVPLAVYGGLLVAVLWAGAKSILSTVPRKTLIQGTAVLGGTALFLLALGYVQNFRVLGRHFAPLFVVVLWSFWAGFSALWEKRFPLTRALAVGFCVASLIACVSLRFASRHAKDGYREAAAEARRALAKGEVVWWNADMNAARFYCVPLRALDGAPVSGAAWFIQNCTRESVDRAPAPQLIVSSKADLYDLTGSIAAYISRGGFRTKARLPAFTLWGKYPD
jgi:hypothetical protein